VLCENKNRSAFASGLSPCSMTEINKNNKTVQESTKK
jgi:hypothetical protein